MSRRPDPLPAIRQGGYCQGCKEFVDQLILVSPHGRYRCPKCSLKEQYHA